MLHGELVRTNGPQARNFIRDCSPSQASLLRGYCFQFGNRVGSQRTMTTDSAWWGHLGVFWSHTWGLILSSHSFWPFPIGEGVMGFSVVTRNCRSLGTEKLPIARVVPSLLSISLLLRDHQKLVEKYLSIPATKKCSGEYFCNFFPCSTLNGTGLGGEGSRVGGRDRVGGPCVNQETLRPTCHIQLHPRLQQQVGWLEWAASVLLNHCEGRLGA